MPRRTTPAGELIAAEPALELPLEPAQEPPQEPPQEPARTTEWYAARSTLENPAGGFWQPGDTIPPGALLAESAPILLERAIIVRMDEPPSPPADDTPQE